MTNIDHDALARRIAGNLIGGGFLCKIDIDDDPTQTITVIVAKIANILREALPTSDPDACEHAVKEGDWCEECNRDYKCAAAEDDES